MRTWEIIAFILFICAGVAAYLGHKLALVLIAAGLAAALVPAVFQLT
jgi:hypothetical protein